MTRTVQPRRTFVSLVIPLLIIIVVAFGVATGTARADEHKPQCGMGEVKSVLQALPVGLINVDNSRGGLGAGVTDCYFRLFADGSNVSFHTSDLIFGGFANFIPYEYLGISQEEAIELLLSSEDRAFLGTVGTPLEDLDEQELTHTVVKRTKIPPFGRVVYQNIGYITQLEPGEYISFWESEWVFGHEEATVHITILD